MPLLFLTIGTFYIIALIVLVLTLIYLGISFLIYKKMLVDYNNPPIDLVDHTEDFYEKAYQWFGEIPKEDIYVTSYDNLKLHGYYIPSYNKKSNNLAIVCHGYQSKATDMIIIGKMYCEMGFQVIMIDQRGHGQSEGNFTSFGYYEKYDLKKWINYALRNYGSDLKILIHGVSLGAATTMMVTSLDIPLKNIKFLLLDSGYTTAYKTTTNTKNSLLLKIFFFGLNIVTYLRHNFWFSNIKPIKAMKKNQIPFLIIQGDKDRVVPVSMANKLLNASVATQKEILIVKDSAHAQGFRVDWDLCYTTLKKEIKDIFKIKKIYNSNE